MNIKKYINPKAIFIGNYSLNDLKIKDNITIDDNLSEQELDNLEYLKNNIYITVKSNAITNTDEIAYFNNVKKILAKLKMYRKTYNITIEVRNRELFRQSEIVSIIPQNINIILNNNNYFYQLSEYLEEEQKLEKLAKPIREANLSPLEKYMAAYDTVKNFKPYKDSETNPNESRELRHILKDDNNYIVCVGYAKLLSELLNRIGIPNKYIHVDVDNSYDNETVEIEKNINHVGHARNIIKIDDDKYNVHGLYLADSTLDSQKKYNVYFHSLMTFDKLKEARNLEKLSDIDLLLDFHDIDEFRKKLAYYLKKEKNVYNVGANIGINLNKRTYKYLYAKIMDILSDIDEKFFLKMYAKYNNHLSDNIGKFTIDKLNEIIANFTTEFYNYIITIVNKEIDMNTILTAATIAKKEISKLSNDEISKWLRKTIDDHNQVKDFMFPYIYDPNNNKEAYLQDRKEKK